MDEVRWTVDELIRRAADALAGVPVPNGRVSPLPDRRVIRWYSTIGLVDRPLSVQGRAARYGPRHLLQLVAVKRRQAEGFALADIQAELTGATDATLRGIARLPNDIPGAGGAAAGVQGAERAPGRHRFWTQAAFTTECAPAEPASAPVSAEPVSTQPASATASALGPASIDQRDDAISGSGELLHGVRLGGSVLLLPAAPSPDDLAAIVAAARPLLELLAERALLNPSEGSRT